VWFPGVLLSPYLTWLPVRLIGWRQDSP